LVNTISLYKLNAFVRDGRKIFKAEMSLGGVEEISFSTAKKEEFVDLTERVKDIVRRDGVAHGLCLVYTGHATGAIIVNENYDPNVMIDIGNCLDSLAPEGKWLHDRIDRNGAAHIKAAILGPSEVIPVRNGSLMLGPWQNICFCEFDGPRERTVLVELVKNAM
jgi:secondary thiamine-phosphate synthase enzyme